MVFVLLIACANIANLLMARATTRQREMAVRFALGAGRRRIARQLLTECILLGIAGGIAGTLLAYGGISGLVSLLPSALPLYHPIHLNGSVLAFASALSLASVLLFGLSPMLIAVRSASQVQLRESASAGAGKNSRRLRDSLVVLEVAIAVVLVVAAGLLMRSFARLTSVAPGFQAAHVVKAEVSLPRYVYSTPQQWALFAKELMQRLQATPGLQNSAIAAPLPIVDTSVNFPVSIMGAAPLPPGKTQTADYVTAGPNYFHVMQIPLLRGRLFSESDRAFAPAVALVSRAFAERYFPNRNPVGKQIVFGFPPNGNTVRQIVGVVGNVRDTSLSKQPGSMMYVPFAQAPLWGGEIVVRSNLDPAAVVASIRAVTHGIDSNLPVTDIETLSSGMSGSVAQPRFRAFLLSLFGIMALALAAIGIFGVISYSVAKRTPELATRVALGAQRGQIVRMVLRESFKLGAIGCAFGLCGAALVSRLLGSFLFQEKMLDPAVFALAVSVALVSTIAAGALPARRAASIDPMQALRAE